MVTAIAIYCSELNCKYYKEVINIVINGNERKKKANLIFIL